jgi:hypothetical protein
MYAALNFWVMYIACIFQVMYVALFEVMYVTAFIFGGLLRAVPAARGCAEHTARQNCAETATHTEKSTQPREK